MFMRVCACRLPGMTGAVSAQKYCDRITHGVQRRSEHTVGPRLHLHVVRGLPPGVAVKHRKEGHARSRLIDQVIGGSARVFATPSLGAAQAWGDLRATCCKTMGACLCKGLYAALVVLTEAALPPIPSISIDGRRLAAGLGDAVVFGDGCLDVFGDGCRELGALMMCASS